MKLKKTKEPTEVSRIRPAKKNGHGGLRRLRIGLLWCVFIAAFAFAIYKNFTAIDRIETVTVERIEEKVVSTQAVEEYAKDFTATYFSWSADTISDRTQSLRHYLNDTLLTYAVNMLPVNVQNRAEVWKNEVWDVVQMDEHIYRMQMWVGQTITNKSGSKMISSGYEVEIYADDAGNMVVTKLPTVIELPEKSSYVKAAPTEAKNMDAAAKAEVLGFLEDFFGVYPAATKQDLKYYADAGVMPVIGDAGYQLSAINEAVITELGTDAAQVHVTVTYTRTATEASETYQYTLTLKKVETWKITAMQ